MLTSRPLSRSRVPDGAESSNAPSLHGVDNLLSQDRVADDDHGLGVELLVSGVGETDDISSPMESVVDDGVGVRATDGVVDVFPKGFLG